MRVDRQTGGPSLWYNRIEFYRAGLLIVWSPNVEGTCDDRHAGHRSFTIYHLFRQFHASVALPCLPSNYKTRIGSGFRHSTHVHTYNKNINKT